MSSINPYSPPQAHVADVADATGNAQPVRLWSPRGRIGRMRYVAYSFGAYIVYALAVIVLAGITASGGSQVLPGLLMGLGFIPYIVFIVIASIQRSHDMGWSGWTTPLILVPFVGLIWLFKGGTAGANRFGAPPPPNTWGVRLLALILPIVFVVGIFAAVAIPAYQGYVKRAAVAGTL
jgi:uncharacterized membrane protein YhaH (DUF805 family)